MGKTEKEVVSSYHRPVCRTCNCELWPEKNGVGVLDLADYGPYELFDADLWKCPKCGLEIVGGFGFSPISAHNKSDFQKMIAYYETRGLLIRNDG